MIWSAVLDPAILPVAVVSGDSLPDDRIVLGDLAPWLTIVTNSAGHEHVLISDGWHHIRLDVEEGHLSGQEAVCLRYRIEGMGSAEAMLQPLRRFLTFCRQRRFVPGLFPGDPGIDRGIAMLRVHDALASGARQREIGTVLFGEGRIAEEWDGVSDSLRSRVRRLVRDAGTMARGGYRHLLRRGGRA